MANAPPDRSTPGLSVVIATGGGLIDRDRLACGTRVRRW